ncbi:NAD-dependent epimerase/dehydratase family protein [Pseudomonas mandelii]|uniref:NAD-dependent epimerase/dehydratase family protein n=1 Tax=Pseudomonas mandelii TaxID=75612 RepID=UPI0020A0B926|nr:NAD-dependent epimerase/dehydratase family protein [Pseudomonas mandelii]MCO8312167.1 NAD-dependent epimerase/dehydratase family protein [Pseudomonas mandelii]
MPNNQRCIVLGASGFIGSRLCEVMGARIPNLKAFGRSPLYPSAFSRCRWIEGNFSDINQVTNAIADCDTVIHLVNATTPASANVNRVADLEANVVSTLNLLDACVNSGVKKVVFISSGGTVYGVPSVVPTPETAENDPITAYGVSKLTIEKYLSLYNHLYGLDYTVLRVANPYGPYQTNKKNQGVIAAFLRHAIHDEPIDVWGDGSVVRDYIFIDDVVSAIELAISNRTDKKVFNIGSGRGVSINEIIVTLEDVVGKKIEVNYMPRRNMDVPISILDISRAAELLKWTPKVEFSQGIQDTFEWVKSSGL